MRRNRRRGAWLKWGSKIIIFGVLLVVAFSPFIQIFPIHTAFSADSKEACEARGGWWGWGTGSEGFMSGFQSSCYTNNWGTTVLPEGVSANSCNSLTSCLANVVYFFTVAFGSVVAYVAAWMFSLAVALSLQGTAYALSFLSTIWTLARDIANLFFILILVYTAFVIMLRAETSETMKRLAWVIVMALLINFSFFFTRVVIDAGNLLAIQIYNAIPATPLSASDTTVLANATNAIATSPFVGGNANTKDLSAKIMNSVGIYTLLSNDSFKKFQNDNNWGILGSPQEFIGLSFIYIAVGVMFFMLAAAFFAAAVKFLIRMAVLWVVLITSPLAFVLNTFEKGRRYFQLWLDTLITHAFYPAAFLFLFYFLTLAVEGITKDGTVIDQTFKAIGGLNMGAIAFIASMTAVIALSLGIVLILMYLCLKASDLMGVWGKEAAGGFARFATRMGSNTLYGGAAWVGRRTIGAGLGAAGRGLANTVPMRALDLQGKRMALPDRSFLSRTMGRAMQAPGSVLANAGGGTYDVRNIPGVGGGKYLLKEAQYGLGEKGRVNYDLGEPSKGNQGRLQRAAGALRGRSIGVPPPGGPPPVPVPVGGPGPLKPPPLAAHATAPVENLALVKVNRAMKELSHKIENSAAATERLTKAVERPKLTHDSSTAVTERLKGVEEALLAHNDNAPPKQITYQPAQAMPMINMEMVKQADGSFSMVPASDKKTDSTNESPPKKN